MSCEYCENLNEFERDDKDGFVGYSSMDIKSPVPECNSRIRILKCVDEESSDWFIEFSVEEDWEYEIPITVGRPYMGGSAFAHTVKDGFECHEWYEIKYCPFCGRKLGADAE